MEFTGLSLGFPNAVTTIKVQFLKCDPNKDKTIKGSVCSPDQQLRPTEVLNKGKISDRWLKKKMRSMDLGLTIAVGNVVH